MIPPIAVTPASLGYTADALARRVADVEAAASHLAHANVVIAVDPRFADVRVEADALWRETARLRDDLAAVLMTLEPDEATRQDSATSLRLAVGGIASTMGATIAGIVDGRAWAPIRPLSAFVERHSPWSAPDVDVTGVTLVDQSGVTTAPETMAARVNRIPRGPDRIRIDRFTGDDGTSFEVYVGGTDFTAGVDDPWWAGENLDLLASGRSRSVAATAEALRLAGVTRDTPVVFTGHSQGGAIALALARSGNYTVDAVFTVGTPVGLVGDATAVPTFHVEHVNDVVPAFGGTLAETTGRTWLAMPAHGEWGIDAHLWESYRDTAARVDATGDPVLTEVERRIRRHGSGTVSVFRASSSW